MSQTPGSFLRQRAPASSHCVRLLWSTSAPKRSSRAPQSQHQNIERPSLRYFESRACSAGCSPCGLSFSPAMSVSAPFLTSRRGAMGLGVD